MKEVEGIIESFRIVGDLDGAVARIQDCLPDSRGKRAAKEALEEFVGKANGGNYRACLDDCIQKVLAKPKADIDKNKSSEKEVTVDA